MFGLISMARRSGLGGSTSEPPGGEMLPDPDINNFAVWDLNFPEAAVVNRGTITSTTGDPSTPVEVLLNIRTAAGQQYRITIDEVSANGSIYRIRMRTPGGSDQLVVNTVDSATAGREFTFTAAAIQDRMRIAFHDVGIELSRISLAPVS